jgi:hypothetical protein
MCDGLARVLITKQTKREKITALRFGNDLEIVRLLTENKWKGLMIMPKDT